MKLWNSRRAGQVGQFAKYMMIGSAAAAFLGLSMNAQAQPTCTIANWTDTLTEGLSDTDAGYQGNDNRRYAGQCGLRVPFDGPERFVAYESAGETNYIARFYVFLDQLSGDAAIFKAEDSGGDVLVVSYEGGDIVLTAVDTGGSTVSPLAISGVGNGWHSVEITWIQEDDAANTEVSLLVNSEDPNEGVSTSLDATGMAIDVIKLGNVDGVSAGGYADFDDFDSRRSTRPGRLCRGLTDQTRDQLNLGDVFAIYDEFASGGGVLADGQPDYNEDGAINLGDVFGVYDAFASGQNSCELNS